MITACHCLSILPDFSTSQLWDEGLVSHKHPVGNFGGAAVDDLGFRLCKHDCEMSEHMHIAIRASV